MIILGYYTLKITEIHKWRPKENNFYKYFYFLFKLTSSNTTIIYFFYPFFNNAF